jgi:2',3'-cyclic-nucleotide 2'-phosphodiesterase (5'-nucleotidase family)
VEVDSEVSPDAALSLKLDDIKNLLDRKVGKSLCITKTKLDARSAYVRLGESVVGNWVSDVSRWGYDADITLLCGGTIRSDLEYGPGRLAVRDVMEMFPFEDPMVLIECTGDQILEALENGVSKWPSQEGRVHEILYW